ncbi:MAG: hypothetical protein EHM28_03245 [Spirochaetaceae bacterium]|nr:MAG: hypothetical protein EHM28_03245 [Spirochaetaceae bacterium]
MHRNDVHIPGEGDLLKKICLAVRECNFAELSSFLQDSNLEGEDSIDEQEKLAIVESVEYWKERMTAIRDMEHYTASEYLLAQWDRYDKSRRESLAPDQDRLEQVLPEQFHFALKTAVFQKALAGYLELYNLSGIADVEVLYRVGRIYKGLGNYESAIESLELAHQQKKNDPRILSTLADSYSLVNETRAAKLFFRESLFIDPAVFRLHDCESSFIHKIVEVMKEEGIPEDLLPYYLPVYGSVLGVFSVKRELKPVEIGRLKQSIHELEQEKLQGGRSASKALLLNRYFWLLDHFDTIKAPRSERIPILAQIKQLDSSLYERYIH